MRLSKESKFGYGFLLAGCGLPYLVDKLLGPTWAISVAVICTVLGVGLLISAHRHKESAASIWRTISAGIVMIIVIGVSIWLIAKKAQFGVGEHIAGPPLPVTGLRVGLSESSPIFLREGKVFRLSKSVLPCARKKIAYGRAGLNTMRGPSSKKPWLVVEATSYQFIDWTGESAVDLLFRMEVTNRGTPSIIKDWELCLVSPDQSIKRFHADATISPLDIGLLGGDSASIAQSAVSRPLEHARVITGWLSFHLPRDVMKVDNVGEMTGTLECRDYLDRASGLVFSTEPQTR